jgi:hypothetical protein
LPTPSFAARRQPSPPTPVKQKNTPSTAGATGNKVNDEGDSTKKGVGATGYDDNNDDGGGGTTGYKVDDYGEGATGDDDYDDDGGDDGDGTERCNNQIKATAAVGGNNSHRHSILMELRGWTYLSTRLHFVNERIQREKANTKLVIHWLALPVQAIRGL